MRVSIVCVYNNYEQLNDCLLRGLKKQSIDFELILLDGSEGKFKSCAAALNSGVENFDFFSPRYLFEVRKRTRKFCEIYM